VDFSFWITLLKQYGFPVGLLMAFIIWQARRIDNLLDRNTSIYEGEIKRLAEVQDLLLTHALGPQPSSTKLPTVKEIQEGIKQKAEGNKKEGK